MSQTAFERYAPWIQAYIYRKHWTDLREVQVEACQAILDTDDHVIIASGTASGKTEAAFFPILTQLSSHPSTSIGVMYIGPLKALINDQFERLTDLLSESGIPVWPWHGDVPQSVKKRALSQARGILQITPESLEAMLMRHPGEAERLFGDLRYVMLDEIHALMGTDRGLQVLCLLTRLERLTHCHPRRIGLSATLNDYSAAMDYLSYGTSRSTRAVGIRTHKRTIGLHVESFPVPADEAEAQAAIDRYHQSIYDACHHQKCLIFTGSRSAAESVIAEMKAIAHTRHEPDIFHVHHGSVSAALRRDAEAALRDQQGPTVTAATLTLELGIDIGDLDSTIQLGAPHSCASFVQRLGRSGRHSGKSRMMFLHLQQQSSGGIVEQMPWSLLQSIAVIQLYLEEHWVEPFAMKEKPFSLLVHQTLSTLMSLGELSPAELARQVLTLPAFRQVTPEEYRALLKHLIAGDVLLRMDEGGIILGSQGEKLTNHYSFYAVFQDEDGWRVFYRDTEIGTLDSCPKQGEVFTLSGRCWKVVGADEARRSIFVAPAESRRIVPWRGGSGDIHTRVVQRMRQILSEDCLYPYLGENAAEQIAAARELAQRSGLLQSHILDSGKSMLLLPWCGTRTLRSIHILLKGCLADTLQIHDVVLGRYHLEIRSGLDAAAFASRLGSLPEAVPALSDDMLGTQRPSPTDKFDGLLPDELLYTSYLHNELELDAAWQTLRALKEKEPRG